MLPATNAGDEGLHVTINNKWDYALHIDAEGVEDSCNVPRSEKISIRRFFMSTN
jgi:hypothetical protein